MKILSFGAGTQSTALALMACDNADMNKPVLHTAVPIYDAVIFCDLGLEPPWVMQQVEFTRRACEAVGIRPWSAPWGISPWGGTPGSFTGEFPLTRRYRQKGCRGFGS